MLSPLGGFVGSGWRLWVSKDAAAAGVSLVCCCTRQNSSAQWKLTARHQGRVRVVHKDPWVHSVQLLHMTQLLLSFV